MQQKPKEILLFEKPFGEESFPLLVLLGASGFSGGKIPKERFWSASVELDGWKRPDDPKVQTGKNQRLVCKADDAALKKLQQWKWYSILLVTVRQDGERFLLCDEPQAANDDQLAAVATKRQKPVHRNGEPIGVFTLNRSISCYVAETQWLGETVDVLFDEDEEEAMAASLATGGALWAEMERWDTTVRAFAADKLLDLKNDTWLGDDEEEFTSKQFIERLSLQTIDLSPGGSFDFWFRDGDLFWGHSIHVTGSLTGGLEDANIEG